MKRYFLIFFALAFTLTNSASAAMMCCWETSNDTTQEQNYDVPPPCHETNETKEMDMSPTAGSGCCEDMSLCNTPLVFGANAMSLTYNNTAQIIELSGLNVFISNSAIPPTPPPKLFL